MYIFPNEDQIDTAESKLCDDQEEVDNNAEGEAKIDYNSQTLPPSLHCC